VKTGFVLWLLGPTSAGKTTVGHALVEQLRKNGSPVMHFDGDEIRAFFGDRLGFSDDDRLQAVATCAYLANKTADAGIDVVVSALTAREEARQYVRNTVKNLSIAYLKCPIETCKKRDSRGLYGKATRGEIDTSTLIGFDSPYPAPCEPEITIDTGKHSISESVDILEAYISML
jgi:adenylylsulfate kinase